MDAKGNEIIPCIYTEINSTTNGYVRCKDKDMDCVVELQTGKEVFRSTCSILDAYENLTVINDGNGVFQLVDRNNRELCSAPGI
jgi:hypothetical protein